MNAFSNRLLSATAVSLLIIAALFSAPVRAETGAAVAHNSAALFYVDASAPSGGDGLTWATAFQTLQSAINKVQSTPACASFVCEIWVAQGVYEPALYSSFNINGGYEYIYGGFSGVETDLSQRDWRAHPTILQGNNSGVVYAYNWLGMLDGFTITGGMHGGELGRGGGIYLYCGSPTLSNLKIVGNSADNYGGGVYAYAFGCSNPDYSPALMNVVISDNTATYGGGTAFLGGHPSLINTAFSNNMATQGDGIYNYSSSPTLTNVTLFADVIYNNIQSKPAIQNSILWGATLSIVNEESTSIPTIAYSLVKGCYPGTWNTACGTDSGHNLTDQDPDFVNENPPDLHLQVDSPVIDQGNNAFIPPYVTATDLDGNPRIQRGVVDLGAYEYTVSKFDQTITFDALSDKVFGDPPFVITATASSGLPVTFTTSSTACLLDGYLVTLTSAGTCTITAHQAGNASYNPAPDVQQSFTIAKAEQTITFPSLADKTYGDPPFDLTASASSGLAVSYTTSSTACSVTENMVTILAAGTCSVTAHQSGNTNYQPAPDVTQSFTIFMAPQSITFDPLPDKTLSDPPFDLTATAS